MIGKPIRCCEIDFTNKESLTPIRVKPTGPDLAIYLLAYLLLILALYPKNKK